MPGKIRAENNLKENTKPKWCSYSSVLIWSTLIAGPAYFSIFGWDFEASPYASSDIAALLDLLRSFSSLISHCYCPVFCWYTDLRQFKKESNKYLSIGEKEEDNSLQSWPYESWICWRALFHRKLLKVILLQRHQYSWLLFSF